MGCGPLLRRQTAYTNVTADLRSKRPAFHTPSVAFGDTFPALRRRGRPAAACRLDDLCERRIGGVGRGRRGFSARGHDPDTWRLGWMSLRAASGPLLHLFSAPRNPLIPLRPDRGAKILNFAPA